MAANRTQSSIAAQMLCERLPLPAYGYRINPSIALRVPVPVVKWEYNVPQKVSNG